ncbi:L-asparaginase [Pleurotus eryngii]|uniref:asparaginase n=1 Tax=Pleurotus eryngii TaxID=5323 RepID=A0A9P6DBJ3_PLEER|nr:L-asparaginase [Pleurotus eryngii]
MFDACPVMEPSQVSDESRVLVIYTGGTIGMLVGQHGYVPEPYFLTETLRSQTRFHDPLQDSLFSNAGSVQGFRQWSSSSGRSSPLTSNTPDALPTPPTHQPTLLVRSARFIGDPSALAPNQSEMKDRPTCVQVADKVFEAYLPSLVTPRTTIAGKTKRIRYAILEWNPLLDSSNIEIEDWIRISTEIELNYHYDAFVILHGTDTMCYTSSALSFLLEDLGKTVIITGAQIPLSQLRNDAVDNLMGALTIAGRYIIPECCLYFNHTLFRGNRVSKTSSFDLSAFSSPNFPSLVDVGIDIVVNWNNVLRQASLQKFRAHKAMSPNVATLRLFPGITAATVRAFLMPPVRGVVLETFGAGNAPQRSDLMLALKEACDRGIIVVAISQCSKGSISDAYETGRTLMQAGVVSGGDMTPECALTKLGYLLSKNELSPGEVRNLIATPLRGELSRPLGSTGEFSDESLAKLRGVVSRFIQLSQPKPILPHITISSDSAGTTARNAAAAWSETAAEISSTEAALLPFLTHLAVARDDLDSLQFCIDADDYANVQSAKGNNMGTSVPGGVINCLDPASDRTPLHVAALNGAARCAHKLLDSGALVHCRDNLGHTSLYYAARQGHMEVVQTLLQAGARLGGIDIEGGYAALAVRAAKNIGDKHCLEIWKQTGLQA